MASAADRMALDGYSRLLPRHEGQHRDISVAVKQTRLNQKYIRITLRINIVARVAKDETLNVDGTSDLRKNADTNHAKEASDK